MSCNDDEKYCAFRGGMMETASQGRACLPPERRVYAVGSIHGYINLLHRRSVRILVDGEMARADPCVVIYLGDYVDRHGHSYEVVKSLIDDLIPNFDSVSLLGNHEAFLLEFLDNPELFVGGWEWRKDRFADCLPKSYLDFLRGLPLIHYEGDYLFVHAGIRFGIPLAEQAREGLLWIREGFLDCEDDFGKIVVHGHTPSKESQVWSSRIGIDTGA